MSGNVSRQHKAKPLSWQTRRALVRSLLAELNELHRHQLTLWKIRSRATQPSNTAAGFVLEHGIGRYGSPLPQGLHQLTDQPGFAHATELMLRDPSRFIYCEGFAMRDRLHGAAHCAWVLDRDNGDHVVDCTRNAPELAVYLGVPLAPSYVDINVRFTGYRLLPELWMAATLRAVTKQCFFSDTRALDRDFNASRIKTGHLAH